MKRKSLKRQIKQHPLTSTLIATGLCYCALLLIGLGAAPAFTSAGGTVSHTFAHFSVKGESVTASDSTYQRPTYTETPSYVSPSSPSSVPEPASLMLMAPALVLLARRFRKA